MRPGIDIVYLPRLPKGETFARGVLTDEEYGQYLASPDKAEFLGGHYAAKEAYMKATGRGLGAARFRDLEIRYENGGAPYLVHGDCRYDISISHDGDYAVAVVLV